MSQSINLDCLNCVEYQINSWHSAKNNFLYYFKSLFKVEINTVSLELNLVEKYY